MRKTSTRKSKLLTGTTPAVTWRPVWHDADKVLDAAGGIWQPVREGLRRAAGVPHRERRPLEGPGVAPAEADLDMAVAQQLLDVRWYRQSLQVGHPSELVQQAGHRSDPARW